MYFQSNNTDQKETKHELIYTYFFFKMFRTLQIEKFAYLSRMLSYKSLRLITLNSHSAVSFLRHHILIIILSETRKSESSLEMSSNGHHTSKDPSWTFICGKCASLFDQKSDLEAHIELCQRWGNPLDNGKTEFDYSKKNPNFPDGLGE